MHYHHYGNSGEMKHLGLITASQNEINRNHNLAVAALERTTAFDLQKLCTTSALYAMLGQFGMNIFTKYIQKYIGVINVSYNTKKLFTKAISNVTKEFRRFNDIQ